MQAVNSAARDGHACGIAAVAYIRDRTVGTVKLNDRLVQIVRINVVAGFTGSGWERATADDDSVRCAGRSRRIRLTRVDQNHHVFSGSRSLI